MQNNYAFVNEKIIDGKKYVVKRSILDKNDEILIFENKVTKVKIKDFWDTNEKIKNKVKDNSEISILKK